jgi:hypothetical protein
MDLSERETPDSDAIRRAREYARNEIAERIAATSLFSVAEVWLVLDDLNEAEARQVCALARRWKLSPMAACDVLETHTATIHDLLEQRRIKSSLRWPV